MPIKKFTILFLVFLLTFTISFSQKNTTPFDKTGTESAVSQNDRLTDSNNAIKFTLSGKTLLVKNLENGMNIEIYSALGAKVQTITYNGNNISLANLNKGIYILRSGKYSQKIIL